mmetsp:Transcript_67358/g.140747  ORF Transcript_67358/g.140747 Transcript_67358/m.140747 type:complete len:222 (+) Transcript_67358:224-889(+)
MQSPELGGGRGGKATPVMGGAINVTFGSNPRKADRRNLKPPDETNRSVQDRIADFCNFRASIFGPDAEPAAVADNPAAAVAVVAAVALLPRPCNWDRRTAGLAVAKSSKSGTATPKAVPRTKSEVAMATTSTSEKTVLIAFLARNATWAAMSSDSWDGFNCEISSETCSSKVVASKVGADTGFLLHRLRSNLEVGEAEQHLDPDAGAREAAGLLYRVPRLC